MKLVVFLLMISLVAWADPADDVPTAESSASAEIPSGEKDPLGCSPAEECFIVPVGETLSREGWLEGDYQLGYEPDRGIAAEKLKGPSLSGADPSNVDAYLEYLSSLEATGRGEEVREKIIKFIALHPDDKRATFLLGVHYARNRKKELALYIFNKLEKDPTFAAKSVIYNNLGMLALQDQNRFAAIEYFEKATKSSPPTAAPFVNLGALYMQSRSYPEAEKLFKRAVDIDADFEDATLGLGGALEAQGKFEPAHQLYTDFRSVHLSALSVV